MWGDDSVFPVPVGFGVKDVLVAGDVAPWGPPFRWAGSFKGISAVLKTVSTSGNVIVDVEVSSDNGGSWDSVLSTKVTIEQGERTSLTATSQPVFSTDSFDENDIFRINITNTGTNAADLTLAVWLTAIGKN